MLRTACTLGTFALIVGAALLTSTVGAADEPSIKDVMQKLHKGADSPLASLKGQLKANPIPWTEVQDATKDFVILGASLAKNDPPKGDAAGYKKLAESYYQVSKVMDDAAREKDTSETVAAFSKLSASCKSCHQAHRGD